MATVTGLTAAYTQAILDAAVVDADINVSGDLIFTRHDGSTFNSGSALPALPAATTTASGIIELATSAEATAGTDAVRAITPATAKAIIDALVINGLADVTITSPVTNDVLQWNGSQWVNRNFVTVTGDVTAAKGRFGGAGPSAAVYVGDDGTLNDVNVGNLIGVQGQQDAQQGGFILGSALDTRLYRSGGQRLKVENEIEAVSNMFIGGTSIGRGAMYGATGFTGSSSGSASTSPGGESAPNSTAGAGTNSFTFLNGHMYKFHITYVVSDNINSSYSVSVFRIYTIGGVNLGGESNTCVANGHLGMGHHITVYAKRVAGSNITTGLAFTIQRYFSGVAGTNFLDSVTYTCEDMGLVADHAAYAAMCPAI